MSDVKLIDLYKSYDKTEVIHGVDLDIYKNEFFSLLGPSGCGKTTLLRMLAGFEKITDGKIQVDGDQICLNDTS